jgi:hypothetical protein
MLRFCLAFAILQGLAMAATAQPAAVQSGEHRGFSRVVARMPLNTVWEISHIENSVTLSYLDFDQGFDISEIFKLIPKDRIAKAETGAADLVLTLACACRVSAFVARDRFLVIDVASPGVALATGFLTKQARKRPQAPPEISAATPEKMSEAAILPLPLPRGIAPDHRRSPFHFPLSNQAEENALDRQPLSDAEQAVLDDVQKRLAREVGTAATRGVLTARPNRPARAAMPLSHMQPENRNSAAPILPDDAPPGVLNNMRISTSMDLPGRDPGATARQSLSGALCPTDDSVNLAGWSDGNPLHTQIGALRDRLFGEFDRLDPEAAEQLAKLYLHFGFGAEAKQILSLTDQVKNDHHLLISIAEILEQGHAHAPMALSKFVDCRSDVALWAMLASPQLKKADILEPAPALLALNKLPVHLRRFLAPELSKRLLSYGDETAAATALRNLERLPHPLPDAARLAQAEIAIKEGDVESGTNQLKIVLENNTELAPEALISLVATRLEEGLPIEPKMAELVEAYARELEETELGPALRHTHVLALIKSGQFDQAFDAMNALNSDATPADTHALRALFLHELTATAGDVVFLDLFFRHQQAELTRLPVEDKMALSTRLLALGFADLAQKVIATLSDRPKRPARQELAARIALALDQPFHAQAELIGLDTPEAKLLRAQAKEMAGAHADAHALYQEAGHTSAASAAAWLADDWRQLTPPETPVFGPLATLSDQPAPVTDTPDGMLARTTAALDESRAAREVLAGVLQSTLLSVPQEQPLGN